jgi:hypothetical protein
MNITHHIIYPHLLQIVIIEAILIKIDVKIVLGIVDVSMLLPMRKLLWSSGGLLL